MVVKVLLSRGTNYEFMGQMNNIHGLDRAHDTSRLPVIIGGTLHF